MDVQRESIDCLRFLFYWLFRVSGTRDIEKIKSGRSRLKAFVTVGTNSLFAQTSKGPCLVDVMQMVRDVIECRNCLVLKQLTSVLPVHSDFMKHGLSFSYLP